MSVANRKFNREIQNFISEVLPIVLTIWIIILFYSFK